ncbi:MAG: CDP-glycerol glycerophosphotransferase family protein [Eubacterium sp.]|nr:CDP-glycerol glycerophosphotransferase family protein [Eubacterium sp.]
MNCKIRRIKWDRIWISFFIENVPENHDVYISGPVFYKLKKSENNPTEYLLNITNPGKCKMLSPGIYKLVTIGNEGFLPIEADKSLDLKVLNRQFRYFHRERAYRVQFANKTEFKIKTSDVKLPMSPLKRLTSIIRTSRHNLAKSILRTIYNLEFSVLHRKDSTDIYNISNPRILLMSDQSEEMGSNMAAFKNALIKNGYTPDEALRAITTKHYSILHWIKTLAKIARADFIFLDDHSQTTDWLTFKGVILTQLWHAGAGFKSTGYSRFGMPASPAPKSGHRQYTYGIAGSRKIRHFFSEVWGINDDMVLPAGMPRLDEFLDEEYKQNKIKEIYDKYPELCKPRKVILFAPTYRGENKRHAYYPYDNLDFDSLYEVCKKKDYCVIFKMHPFVAEKTPIPESFRDRMLDMSDYPNINDLLYITDLLITDYSSNIYEFSLMHKPMLFYAFDIDEYSKERGFHRDYRKNTPGKVVETFDDMISAIEKGDFEYEKVEEYLENNFEYIDSNSCHRIIDWVIRGNIPEELIPKSFN